MAMAYGTYVAPAGHVASSLGIQLVWVREAGCRLRRNAGRARRLARLNCSVLAHGRSARATGVNRLATAASGYDDLLSRGGQPA